MLAQDDEPGFEGGVGEAFSTLTMTRSKRDQRHQRLRRERVENPFSLPFMVDGEAQVVSGKAAS